MLEINRGTLSQVQEKIRMGRDLKTMSYKYPGYAEQIKSVADRIVKEDDINNCRTLYNGLIKTLRGMR